MNEMAWLACKNPRTMLEALADKADERKLRLFLCACCRRLWPLLTDERSRAAVEAFENSLDEAVAGATWPAVQPAAAAVEAAQVAQAEAAQAAEEAQRTRTRTWAQTWAVEGTPVPAALVQTAAEQQETQAAAEAAQAALEAARVAEAATSNLNPARATVTQAAELAVRAVGMSRLAALSRARAARWLQRAEEEADRPVTRKKAALRAAQVAEWVEQQEETAREKTWRTEERALRAERQAQCDLLRDIFGFPGRAVSLRAAWLKAHDGRVIKLARSIYDERRFQDLPVLADALEEAGCTNEALLSHCRTPGEHVRGCWVVDALLAKG
jgi:hypothetical protein